MKMLRTLKVNKLVAHIVCGSPNLWLPTTLTGYIVGVDRGALKLIEKHFDFDAAIGDFDSVSKKQRQLIKDKVKNMLELPANKDLTDCEAAVEYVVSKGYREIHLYGTTGLRFDHQFATLSLMLKYAKRDVQIYMEDAQNKISILEAGVHQIQVENVHRIVGAATHCAGGKRTAHSEEAGISHRVKIDTKNYISFFALENTAKNLILQGVKYPLDGYDLAIDNSLCISNEAIDATVNVSFDSGYLLVVQSSDLI